MVVKNRNLIFGKVDKDGIGKGAGYYKICEDSIDGGLYTREYDMMVIQFTQNQIMVYKCIFDILEMTKRLEESYEWSYKHVVGIEATSSYPTKDHAWNEISGRYVPVEEYYIPDIWRQQSEDNKQASAGAIAGQEKATDKYKTALSLIKHYYDELLELGVAKEQARVLLPLSAYTEVYWTASFQAIVNFIELRDEPTAQWEIREYARALKKLIFGIYPKTAEIWSDLYWE